jgi:hypothetical protein
LEGDRHTVHLADAMRLDQALRRLSKLSETHVFADWAALSEIAVHPTDRIKINADQAPLIEIVDALCQQIGGDCLIVSRDVLQITSRESAAQSWQTVFHPVDHLIGSSERSQATPQELIASIYDEVGSEWFSSGRGAIEFDTASHCLIVRLPQPQQRLVDRLLRTYRA